VLHVVLVPDSVLAWCGLHTEMPRPATALRR
jgi:hypothetical protein